MISEISAAEAVSHYLKKALAEVGNDAESFLNACMDIIESETAFLQRADAVSRLQTLVLLKARREEGVQEAINDLQENEQSLEVVKEEREPKNAAMQPNSGNGADFPDRYRWVQTLSECTVTLPIPAGTKGKACDVNITANRLLVGLKGQKPLLEGVLYAPVHPDDSTWTIDGTSLEVTLAKVDQMKWWKSVIQGEPEIDLQNVSPENSKLSDLDGETRAAVEKMMFDQKQKALGRPTSDEQRKHDAMAQFMAAHPELDFSQAKLM